MSTMNESIVKTSDFSLTIRQMQPDEIDASVQLFSDAGLHESPSTVQAFYEYDPTRFIVAVNEDKNQVVGCCGGPVTTHDSAFMGMYAVDKRYLRLGIGMQVYNACWKAVGENRNGGCASIPEMFDRLKQDRFKIEEGCSVVVAEGKIPGPEQRKTLDKLANSKLKLRKLVSVEYDEDLVKAIVAFDEKVHCDNRDKLLRIYLAKEDIMTYSVLDSNDEVIGYGCIKPNRIGQAMPGPLYAINDDIAEVIMGQLLRCNSNFNDEIIFFTASKSTGGVHLAKEVLKLLELERCEKLYSRFVPPFNYAMQYCCHSPDFAA